jgi:hypothetical protein
MALLLVRPRSTPTSCWLRPNELLEAKVREAIADGWYPEDDGPMPEDFGDLIEKYQEASGDTCYFGDWGYTVIDSTLCTRVEDEQ